MPVRVTPSDGFFFSRLLRVRFRSMDQSWLDTHRHTLESSITSTTVPHLANWEVELGSKHAFTASSGRTGHRHVHSNIHTLQHSPENIYQAVTLTVHACVFILYSVSLIAWETQLCTVSITCWKEKQHQGVSPPPEADRESGAKQRRSKIVTAAQLLKRKCFFVCRYSSS